MTVLLIVPRELQAGGELRSKAGDQQAVLVGGLVIRPNNFEPLSDAAFGYRGHDGRCRVVDTRPADRFAARGCTKDRFKLEPGLLDVLRRRQACGRHGARDRRSNNRRKCRGNIGD